MKLPERPNIMLGDNHTSTLSDVLPEHAWVRDQGSNLRFLDTKTVTQHPSESHSKLGEMSRATEVSSGQNTRRSTIGPTIVACGTRLRT